MSKTDGGPAFPYDNADEGHAGMSLRDWFAGMAMQGLLSGYELGKGDQDIDWDKIIAKEAYKTADAMLKEKEVKR